MAKVDIRAMRHEVAAQPERWLANTKRQDEVAVQRETESIFLRSAVRPDDKFLKLDDIHASRLTPHAASYPAIMQWTQAFARREGKRVARMLLAKLKPHGQVYPHVDGGDYYQIRDRYHLVLASPSGSHMACGDEEVVMREGDVWWFDNKQRHTASNATDSDRIHLIFDLEYPD
jgi:hypothetical protein